MISTEAYDWREYLHNSLHHTKAEFNNCFTIHSRPRAGRLEHSKQVANDDAADFTELLYILITRTWLVSLIGRALHKYRRGPGFESRTTKPEFFQAFFSQLQKLRL